jgi:hypothetical protein
MDDLWPSNIGDTTLVTPVSILKEQSELLGQKTRQLVSGEVTTQTTGNLFVHSFYLWAPALGYRYELFRASHGVSFYPLNLTYLNNNTQIKSEAEFKERLKEIFSAQHTVTTVQSILAMSRP